jgi:hypothetical protein
MTSLCLNCNDKAASTTDISMPCTAVRDGSVIAVDCFTEDTEMSDAPRVQIASCLLLRAGVGRAGTGGWHRQPQSSRPAAVVERGRVRACCAAFHEWDSVVLKRGCFIARCMGYRVCTECWRHH